MTRVEDCRLPSIVIFDCPVVVTLPPPSPCMDPSGGTVWGGGEAGEVQTVSNPQGFMGTKKQQIPEGPRG